MKKIIVIGACALSFAALAQVKPIGIASGSQSGTNYPMVNDIVAVCSKPNMPVNNVVSEGSIDNLFKVYQDPNAQFGIVQVDALEYQKGLDPQMMSKIKMVFPFFSTEMHLVAKSNSSLNSLHDLAGKRVVEGPQGSGTWVTAQVIKQLTGIKWVPIILSQQDGMNAVIQGQADAEFIVAGAPVSVIQNAKQAVKLLNVSHPALDQFGLYKKAVIPSGFYGTTTTFTYTIPNAMVTFDFRKERQAEISSLVSCIVGNIEKLQSQPNFHPKWRSVVPKDINSIKWPAHQAALNVINRK